MKTIRFMALCMALVLFASLLAGCGNSTSLPLKGNVTLKRFLDSGPKIGFRTIGTPSKNTHPTIYLFEDGKVYMVSTVIVKGCPTDNWIFNRHIDPELFDEGSPLTLGDISKMTDEELLEFARAHKTLEWSNGDLYAGVDYHIDGRITDGYSLHVYTDKTGNHTEYEHINIGRVDKTQYIETDQVTIYTSVFSGVKGDADVRLYFRTGEDLTITLDNPGDAGVAVD